MKRALEYFILFNTTHVCLSACLSVFLSVCFSVCLSIYLSVFLSFSYSNLFNVINLPSILSPNIGRSGRHGWQHSIWLASLYGAGKDASKSVHIHHTCKHSCPTHTTTGEVQHVASDKSIFCSQICSFLLIFACLVFIYFHLSGQLYCWLSSIYSEICVRTASSPCKYNTSHFVALK